MKKRLRLVIMELTLAMLITGCNNQTVENTNSTYNTVFEKYANEEVIGLIINEPTQEELEDFTKLETYKYSEGSEKMIIVPKYNDSKVTINQVELTGSGFVVKEILYSKEETEKNYGLLIEAVRPEGIPQLMIRITAGEKSVEYLVTYNGKDGTQKVEYLTLGESESTEEEIKQNEIENREPLIISSIPEGDYLEGYNLLDRYEVDIDYDETMESLEVYSTAALDEKGQMIMDDGQEWVLIIRKGNEIYPVFNSFIQLGQLEYKVYSEYAETNVFHLLISKVQGAGITMYDCYYDKENQVFVSKKVYQTTGNIGIEALYN